MQAVWGQGKVRCAPHPVLFSTSHHVLLIILSLIHHHCLQDCLHDPGNGLSQDQSFHLNWAPRSSSKCLVLPSPENTVHVVSCLEYCLLSNPVFLFKASVSGAHCQFLVCKGWEWGDARRACDQVSDNGGYLWGRWLVSLLITNPW